ncbi:MAG: S46 family peptidase [Rikenellaceae bacterium]
MYRRFLLLLVVLFPLGVFADEGMWLVNLIKGQLYQNMVAAGVAIDGSAIYSEDEISIKDAIVAIDHGQCSGTIISPEGLMITNHHCAYSDIHAKSTIENNYLENGFWAADRADEIPIEGKSVTFLKRVEDVTDQVNIIADSLDKISVRGVRFLGKVEKILTERIESEYQLELNSMWRGQRYYLYYYEVFEDVRLVAAPPLSIGAFGGEQDNWSWPQHKGDFTLYRVYSAPDGSPAKYSSDNIPLKADKYIKVSTAGYTDGDYTMILGYPGSTNRYIPSAELIEKYEILNPTISSVRRAKLDVWKRHMDADAQVRLKYADKYFGVSNYCDFAKWENLSIAKYGIIEEREAQEAELREWISRSDEREAKYGELLSNLDTLYALKADLERNKAYIRETLVTGSDVALLAQRLKSLRSQFNKSPKINCKESAAIQKFYNSNLQSNFVEGDAATDKELFREMLTILLDNVDLKYLGEDLSALILEFDRDADKLTEYIYTSSIITDEARFTEFFSGEITKADIERDPMFILGNGINIMGLNAIEDKLCDNLGFTAAGLKSLYTEALYKMQMEEGRAIYPDANSTMRLTYGNVGSLVPRDGVRYHYQTTAEGVLAKHNPEDYEFALLPHYKSLLEQQQRGRWAESGTLYVNFITDNDITGGNSGSSVLNAKGELIGLAFDGNRESMGGDLQFNSDGGKCVCVDIRYVMWVVEKLGGASYIIDEIICNSEIYE